MKKWMLIVFLGFIVSFDVAAKKNTNYSQAEPRNKSNLCAYVGKLISTGKISNLEPSYDYVDIGETSKKYISIDIDRDGIFDEVNLGCGSSGECSLSLTLSSGEQIDLNENLMFYLTKIGNDIFVPVIAGKKEDFPNEGSVLGGEFYLREKHLAKLYKLTSNKAVLVCQF